VTVLLDQLKRIIVQEGPISVERYMGLCLQAYYGSRDPFGVAGDFTTAPEISQMFGELIGLWAAQIWHDMGAPRPLHLVELGPGRGTLMADALRAAKIVPGFSDSVQIHLVETSATLRMSQKAVLASFGQPISWHDRIDDVPPGPALIIANEFFDALPIRQFVGTERGWCERLVGLHGDELTFGLFPEPERSLATPVQPGEVLEWPALSQAIMSALARRLAQEGGAALIVDYGYWGPALGDTLQAVRSHKPVDPLRDPGEADLTAHVDFHHLATAANAAGASVHGPATQADFLSALGIHMRAENLKRRADAAQAEAIDAALARLTEPGPTGMGQLFKVLAVSHPSIAAVPGLPPQRFAA